MDELNKQNSVGQSNKQRLFQARKIGGVGDFANTAQRENQARLKQLDSSEETRGETAKQDLKRSRVLMKSLWRKRQALAQKKEKGVASGMASSVDFGKDGIYFVIFAVAVLTDLVTLIPIVGGTMSLIFIPMIWMLYLVAGHFKKRWGMKASTNMVTQAAETLGVGISALPFYTVNAFVNYFMVLWERSQGSPLELEEEDFLTSP